MLAVDVSNWLRPSAATSPDRVFCHVYGRGTAAARTWDRLHPRLTRRSAWISHGGPLPVIDGTLIRLQVDHLPGDRTPKPTGLWCSVTGVPPAAVDRLWQASLRRFDLEHTFRPFGQVSAGPPRNSVTPRLRTGGLG